MVGRKCSIRIEYVRTDQQYLSNDLAGGFSFSIVRIFRIFWSHSVNIHAVHVPKIQATERTNFDIE